MAVVATTIVAWLAQAGWLYYFALTICDDGGSIGSTKDQGPK